MDDFDDNSERESYVSEGEKGSDSDLDEDSAYRELVPEVSGRALEQQIIDKRLRAVLDFNAGLIQPVEYFTILKKTEQELEQIQYEDDVVDEQLIEKESELNVLLATFIDRIKQIPDLENYISSKKNVLFDAPGLNEFLTQEELGQINELKTEIENIRNKYTILHPELDDPEPLPSTIFEAVWQSMDFFQQYEIKNLAKAAKLVFPERQNYSSDELFSDAQFEFYNQIKMFLPGYFDFFEKKEKAEIETVAKTYKIHKPLISEYNSRSEYDTALEKFYKDVSQLLPGYVMRMNVRSIGSSYELMNEKSILKSIVDDASKTIAITLSEEDEELVKSQKVLKTILRELESDKLIDCIMSSDAVFKQKEVEPYTKYKRTKRIDQSGKVIRGMYKDSKISEPSLRKEQLPTLTPEERKEYFRKRALEESQNIEVLRKKDKVMAELMGSRKWKNVKIPEYTQLQTQEVQTITTMNRNTSKRRLTEILNTCSPEFRPNVTKLVDLIEDYIFRLTNILPYPFLEYTNKIDELIFVLKNYKFFINDLLSGKINPYQFALFQKEIYSESKLHAFTVKVQNRRFIIKQIYYELLNAAQKNNIIINGLILTKFLINFKSKRLELMLYDLSSSKKPSETLSKWERENVYQKNEKYYLELSKKLLNLLKNPELSVGIITNGINSDQILQSLVNNVTHQSNPDYSQFTIKDIETLMSQELESIKDLGREKKKLDAINYSGIYIMLWKPEIEIFTPSEIANWNKLVKSSNIMYHEKSVNFSWYIKKLNELERFKQKMLNSHGLQPDLKLKEVTKMLNYSNKKLNDLKSLRLDKINRQNEVYRQRYINYLKNKFGALPPPVPTSIQKYKSITPDLIYQVVQAYKRSLITDTVMYKILGSAPERKKLQDEVSFLKNYKDFLIKENLWNQQRTDAEKSGLLVKIRVGTTIEEFVKPPPSAPIPPQVQYYRNKLIELLQIYDLNELNNSQKYITDQAYIKIKNKVIIEIDQLIKLKFVFVDQRFMNTSINDILEFLKIKFNPQDTFESRFDLLVASWPKEYRRQNTIVDFYGDDIFYKLLQVKDPINFYDEKEIRVYNSMVTKNTQPNQEIYKRPRVLFNAKTGKFGNEANDGELYDVFKLDRDPSTLKPINISKQIMEKDSRTGLYVPVTKVVQKQGKYSFILRELRTNRQNVTEKEWIEVPAYAIKMYPLNYDSCSRFNKNKTGCVTGKGLKNAQCEYNEASNICYAKK